MAVLKDCFARRYYGQRIPRCFLPSGQLNPHFLLQTSARATFGQHWVLRDLWRPRWGQIAKLSDLTTGALPCLLPRSPEDTGFYHALRLPRHIRRDMQRCPHGDAALVCGPDGQCKAHGDPGGWGDLECPGNDVWRFNKCPENCHQWQKVRENIQRNTLYILAMQFTINIQLQKQICKNIIYK